MIVGISGLINSGKSVAASYLSKKYNFRQDSFAATLKDICSNIFDWPRHLLEGDTPESRQWREQADEWWSEKLNITNFTPRLAFQLIGTNCLRNHFNTDIWFLTLQNRIRKNKDQDIVLSDARFQNEINFVKDNNGILIKINRGPEPEWYDIAANANFGCEKSRNIMNIKYSTVHLSEWAWAGTKFNYILDNNNTLEHLYTQIDKIIEK
jgi:hypothetical protein